MQQASAASTWKMYGACSASVQRLQGEGVVTVYSPCCFLASEYQKLHFRNSACVVGCAR